MGGFAKTALIKFIHVFTAQKRLEVARPGSLALAQHKPTLRLRPRQRSAMADRLTRMTQWHLDATSPRPWRAPQRDDRH